MSKLFIINRNVIVFTLLAGGGIGLVVYFGEYSYIGIPGGVYLLLLIILNCFPIVSKIGYDQLNNILIIKTVKIFCCCNKSFNINSQDISEVIVSVNPNISLEVNGKETLGFNLQIGLKSGNRLTVINGQLNSDNESEKIVEFLKQYLPQDVNYKEEKND